MKINGGSYVDDMWVKGGLYVGHTWMVCGLKVGYTWIKGDYVKQNKMANGQKKAPILLWGPEKYYLRISGFPDVVVPEIAVAFVASAEFFVVAPALLYFELPFS